MSAGPNRAPETQSRQRGSFEPAKKGGRRKFVVVIIVVLLLVLAAVIGWVVLSHSPVMRIEKIEAVGVRHLTPDELEQLAAVPEDATLLNVDSATISKNLLRDAWFQSVDIARIPPDVLRITVTERAIGAVVSIPSSNAKTVRKWIVAEDGTWIMPIPSQDSEAGQATSQNVYTDAEKALKITDVPYGEQPEIGTPCTNKYVNTALEVVRGLTTSLKDRVQSVRAAEAESVTLVLDNNVEIVFGDASNIRDKERVCLEILDEHGNGISYINVRSVENPTWRSI